MVVTIIDFSSVGDEEAYQRFLENYPNAIVVNEGEAQEPDRAHRAGCSFARKRSDKANRWTKFCFQDATVLEEISGWYQPRWINRQVPQSCQVCRPDLPRP